MVKKMDKQTKKDLRERYKSRAVIGGIFCIKCRATDKFWLKATTDMQSAKNRFAFNVNMNSCPETSMLKEWKQYGMDAFSFEVLEEIKKKETQTDCEFSDDVDTLLEIWTEKLNLSPKGGIEIGTEN